MQDREVNVKQILDKIYDSVPDSIKKLGTIYLARALYLALCLEVGFNEMFREYSLDEDRSQLYSETEALYKGGIDKAKYERYNHTTCNGMSYQYKYLLDKDKIKCKIVRIMHDILSPGEELTREEFWNRVVEDASHTAVVFYDDDDTPIFADLYYDISRVQSNRKTEIFGRDCLYTSDDIFKHKIIDEFIINQNMIMAQNIRESLPEIDKQIFASWPELKEKYDYRNDYIDEIMGIAKEDAPFTDRMSRIFRIIEKNSDFIASSESFSGIRDILIKAFKPMKIDISLKLKDKLNQDDISEFENIIEIELNSPKYPEETKDVEYSQKVFESYAQLGIDVGKIQKTTLLYRYNEKTGEFELYREIAQGVRKETMLYE